MWTFSFGSKDHFIKLLCFSQVWIKLWWGERNSKDHVRITESVGWIRFQRWCKGTKYFYSLSTNRCFHCHLLPNPFQIYLSKRQIPNFTSVPLEFMSNLLFLFMNLCYDSLDDLLLYPDILLTWPVLPIAGSIAQLG